MGKIFVCVCGGGGVLFYSSLHRARPKFEQYKHIKGSGAYSTQIIFFKNLNFCGWMDEQLVFKNCRFKLLTKSTCYKSYEHENARGNHDETQS